MDYYRTQTFTVVPTAFKLQASYLQLDSSTHSQDNWLNGSFIRW
jgi:hypothetical protein